MANININRKTVLCLSNFDPLSEGHGGNRRSAQLKELLNSIGLDTKVPQKKINPKYKRLLRYYHGIKSSIENRLSVKDIRELGLYGHHYLFLNQIFQENYTPSLVVLWEATNDFLIPHFAKKWGCKIIATPHNLESLVVAYEDVLRSSHIVNFQTLLRKLSKEVAFLAKSQLVFCISREEQWILNLLGIPAFYLPYYPPKNIMDNLLNIRQAREDRQRSKFLILGTALNPPTFMGMLEQISLINILLNSENHKDIQIDVVGYGTERLKKFVEDKSVVNIVGSVSDKELYHMLLQAKAVLIHQISGVGALTKISEMLIAGIPVIANGTACRSAFHYNGVYCYDTIDQLSELLKKNLNVPDIPSRPNELENFFKNKVLDLF